MKLIMGAAAALCVVSGAAFAQSNSMFSASACSAPDDPFRPCGMAPNFDADTLMPILAELGLTAQKRTDDNGAVYIAANYNNALNFTLAPSACSDNNVRQCIGLTTFAYFSGGSINPQTVSAFNQKYAFISTGLLSDGGAYISRYDIADFGVPRGNIRSSIGNFVNLAARFSGELAGSGRTVSLEGFADDMASDTLNTRQLVSFDAAQEPLTPAEMHEKAMAATPIMIREMAADPATPRNKIENVKPR